MRNNVVPVDVYAHSIYPEKPVEVPGCEYKHNVISFDPSIRLDIPGVEFGYDIETREFVYKKDGGEWTPMNKGKSKEFEEEFEKHLDKIAGLQDVIRQIRGQEDSGDSDIEDYLGGND